MTGHSTSWSGGGDQLKIALTILKAFSKRHDSVNNIVLCGKKTTRLFEDTNLISVWLKYFTTLV